MFTSTAFWWTGRVSVWWRWICSLWEPLLAGRHSSKWDHDDRDNRDGDNDHGDDDDDSDNGDDDNGDNGVNGDGDNGDGDNGDGDSGVGDPREYRKALTGLHFRHMRAFVPCSTQCLTAVKIVLQAQRMIFSCAVQQLQIETRVNESKLEVNDNLLEIDLW